MYLYIILLIQLRSNNYFNKILFNIKWHVTINIEFFQYDMYNNNFTIRKLNSR